MGNAVIMDYAIIREQLSDLSEDELVKSAQKGDLDSFNRLVLIFQDRIYAFVSHILWDEDLAADITQDTFIRAYQNLPRFRNGSFRSWIYRIAKNAAFDELRRHKQHTLVSLDYEDPEEEKSSLQAFLRSDDPLPEQVYEKIEQGYAIQAALARLNKDQRAVVTLIDLQDLDYQEAADALGVNIGTVKSRLARARQQLRTTLLAGGN